MRTILIAILAVLSLALVGVLVYQKLNQPATSPIVVNQPQANQPAVNQVQQNQDETAIQEPITLEDESTIKTNIIRKTGIKWEVINVDISSALSVTLRRGYPQDAREGQTLLDRKGTERIVKDFLILLKDELGISSVSDIVLDEVNMSSSIIVKYHQDYKNIPVYDSFGLISMTKYGEIYTMKYIWYPNVAAPTVPEITMAKIKQIALDHYKVDNIDFFEEPKLYVFSPNKLIWLVKMGEPVNKDVIMDALTGVVLSEQSNLMR